MPAGDGRVKAAAGLICAAVIEIAAIALKNVPVLDFMVLAPFRNFGDQPRRLSDFKSPCAVQTLRRMYHSALESAVIGITQVVCPDSRGPKRNGV
jgi:hypothetical protein